uniref:Uncharacterized protein n=1 Tax=Rhipicephalus appendiculatus TaxID=34631 RepID=A0A131YR51_RHIAP
MMPSNKHDPYQELEAYLRQAQAEVGRAVEDLLASESTGSSSSCAGSRKNSCPDLYSIGVADDSQRTPRKFVATYTSLSAPRPRRSVNGIGGSSPSEKAQSTAALVETNGSRGRRASDGETPTCAWDSYYGWESLQLSRPPSGDAQLLSIYTERLVEAVNGSFAEELFPLDDEGPSTECGSDAVDQSTSTAQEATEASRIAGAGEQSVSEASVRGDGVENAESDAAVAAASPLRDGSELDSPIRTEDGESSANKKFRMVRSSSWPDLTALRIGHADSQPLTSLCGSSRAGSCPETSADRCFSGVAPSSVVDIDSSQAISYDGSLYKNQQLYYESDEGDDGEEAEDEEPSTHDSFGSVKNASAVEEFTEVELRISDSDHDDDTGAGAALPELFIREDECDELPPPVARDHRAFVPAPMSSSTAALRDSFTLDLRSPGLVRSRLNPYTIEVIANHASSPDEVLATVSTLEARLASRPLPPLVIDENEADTGTWSSTSTAHSASTVSRHELEEFLKSVEPPHDPPSWPQDAVTQTTPEISRSSSFTCVTECGEELGSSKESLAAAHNDAITSSKTQHTLAVATQSPSPVCDSSSSSSCDAPPTPLTPRASPSSQDVVSSDLSDSAAHGAATVTASVVARPLQNGSSPSLPALDGRVCAQMSTQRQRSLEEKPQIRSLSRPTTKAAAKKSPEVTSTLPWTAPQQLSHKASSAPVLLKNRPPTSLGDSGTKTGLVPDAAGSSPEEEVKVREHVVFWPRRCFAKPSSRR